MISSSPSPFPPPSLFPSLPSSPIPITCITGYLGSGKSTIILHIVSSLRLSHPSYRIVWLKNEYGDVKVDSLLASQSSISVKEINSGCLCCTTIGRLEESIKEIMENYSPDRIIIETSGASQPAPLAWEINRLSTLSTTSPSSFPHSIRLDSLINVVDCSNFTSYSDKSFTAKTQSKYTDVIIFNKSEGVSENVMDKIMDDIMEMNAMAVKLKTKGKGEIDPFLLLSLDGKSINEQIFSHGNSSLFSPSSSPPPSSHPNEKEVCLLSIFAPSNKIYKKNYIESVLKELDRESVYRVKGMLYIEENNSHSDHSIPLYTPSPTSIYRPISSTDIEILQDSSFNHAGSVWDAALLLSDLFIQMGKGKVKLSQNTKTTDSLSSLHQQFSSLLKKFSSSPSPSSSNPRLSLIELGSGTGVGGIVAANSLPPSRVVITDLTPILPLIQHNINHYKKNKNHNSLQSELIADSLDWGNSEWSDKITENGPYDLIFGSDLIYLPDTFPLLVSTLQRLSSPNKISSSTSSPLILFTYEKRKIRELSFFSLLDNHFIYDEISSQLEWESDYSCKEIGIFIAKFNPNVRGESESFPRCSVRLRQEGNFLNVYPYDEIYIGKEEETINEEKATHSHHGDGCNDHHHHSASSSPPFPPTLLNWAFGRFDWTSLSLATYHGPNRVIIMGDHTIPSMIKFFTQKFQLDESCSIAEIEQ